MRSLYNIVTLCFFVSITISITVTFTATTVSCFTLPNSNSYRMGKKTVVRKDIVKNKLSNNSAIRTRNSNNRSYGTGVLASSSNSDGNSGVTPTMSDVAKVADPSNSIGNSGGNSGGNDTEPQQKQLSLDFSQLKPFLRIAIPFFKEDEVARSSIIGVTALTLLNSGISVAFSYVSRDFYNALNSRDESLFYEKIMLFFIYLILAVPVSVYYRFIREKLSIYWREALTAKVLDKYYSNRSFYILETLREVDNPDQRITEDIRHFTKTSLDFFITIFTSIIDLFSFSAILFQIYPGLFVAIILYAGIGSVITTKLGEYVNTYTSVTVVTYISASVVTCFSYCVDIAFVTVSVTITVESAVFSTVISILMLHGLYLTMY